MYRAAALCSANLINCHVNSFGQRGLVYSYLDYQPLMSV